MDIKNLQNPDQAKQHADSLQSQIDDLNNKASHSSDKDKQFILQKVGTLKDEKNATMKKIKDLEQKGKDLGKEAKGAIGEL